MERVTISIYAMLLQCLCWLAIGEQLAHVQYREMSSVSDELIAGLGGLQMSLGSFASNLEQVADLLCAQVNSAFSGIGNVCSFVVKIPCG